ncbi:IS4 family transposase [Rhodopirellula sp. JC740]|uniref:IS4 family transposase n=1 Tax=Rhodopirellula halodulae TaxID=2894198 RepID=A0ABS8NNH3_9BACT|nr:IS4 family transposase [Rhodopirellula sp. JC740]MCC9644338.1 IS4 family transposase [Rhodopirellula sp. JC740]
MLSQWVTEELQEVELYDKRLEARFRKLLDCLSKASNASIPAACDDRAEMVAAYRFFDNEKVEFENVLQPHIESSYHRVRGQRVALLVQDTTELDLTRPHSEVEGTGPLQNGNRCGALLHLLHAFTPDGTPLGTLLAEAWAREPKADSERPKRGSSAKRMQVARKPFEEKETYRWLTTAEHCAEIKSSTPDTQLIMLADRESDITEVIDYCRDQNVFDWVIRSEGSRVLNKKRQAETSVSVHDALRETKPLFERELDIRQRHSWGNGSSLKHLPSKADRQARVLKVNVHAKQITLNDPRAGRCDGVQVNAVLVREKRPSKHHQPIEWLLLTSLPIDTTEKVKQVLDYYLQRWMIELFFKVLKSGCKIESRRFEHMDRFLPALSLYLIVAWRSLYVCRVSRAHPKVTCEVLYSEAEWKGVWQVVTKTAPPRKPPGLMTMTRLMAQRGGYINRKDSGPPGPQTVWLGLREMHTIAECWLTFGPGANKTCV